MNESEYVREAYKLVSSNPTSQHLDELIEAHTQVSYFLYRAETATNKAEAEYKLALAKSVLKGKAEDPKRTQQMLDAQALIDANDVFTEYLTHKAMHTQLRLLLQSITEAINGIKFIGRMGG